MLNEVRSSGSGVWPRLCDSCRSTPCAVYCQADSAYLCTNCDSRVHSANHVASRHERVWICEACECAPAAFACKADAASLCTTCDAEIHSANPLARRHHRVPILPIHGHGSATHFTTRPFGSEPNIQNWLFDPKLSAEIEDEVIEEEEEDDETTSWLLLDPVKNNNNSNYQSNKYDDNNSGYCLFEGEIDEYLDLVEYNNISCPDLSNNNNNQFMDRYNQQQQQQQQQQHNFQGKNDGMSSDSVVPVNEQHQQQQNVQLEMDYEALKAGFSYTASISQSIALSSMDTNVVPECTTSHILNSHTRPSKGTIDLLSSSPIQFPTQFSPMDREARVLRYKEKRKNRKFEKTIRYASRKAYAETRPRIKGRFAKRTDVEVEQMFSNTVIAESGYGVVPAF